MRPCGSLRKNDPHAHWVCTRRPKWHVVHVVKVAAHLSARKAHRHFDKPNCPSRVGDVVDLRGPIAVEYDGVAWMRLARAEYLWGWGVAVDDTAPYPACPSLCLHVDTIAVVGPLWPKVGPDLSCGTRAVGLLLAHLPFDDRFPLVHGNVYL